VLLWSINERLGAIVDLLGGSSDHSGAITDMVQANVLSDVLRISDRDRRVIDPDDDDDDTATAVFDPSTMTGNIFG
jgi:hypothetical protein